MVTKTYLPYNLCDISDCSDSSDSSDSNDISDSSDPKKITHKKITQKTQT